jgi:hypothetical protein
MTIVTERGTTQTLEIITIPHFSVSSVETINLGDSLNQMQKLQQLVYAIYTKDGKPAEVQAPCESDQGEKELFIIATSEEDLTPYFNQNPNPQIQNIAPELRQFPHLAGFLKIQWGEFNGNNSPIEAMHLLKFDQWPKDKIGYAGSFTTNPLLHKSVRLELQRSFHDNLYQLALDNKFEKNIFTVLQTHVLSFVNQSGLTAQLCDGSQLNFDNPRSRQIFNTFPKYWLTDPSPQLYRFIPNNIR